MVAYPAAAKVHRVTDRGFVIRIAAEVPAGADATWREMIKPQDWWSAKHSYSGDPANFTLDARPGGCFCEALPAVEGAPPRSGPRGGVEHMRVVYVERPRALRMVGPLGPLQAEALTGTLTMALKPAASGTQILWEYVVGGYMRAPLEKIAPLVDAMMTEQLASLVQKLGGVAGARPIAIDQASADKPAQPGVDAEFLGSTDAPLTTAGQTEPSVEKAPDPVLPPKDVIIGR